MKKEIINRLKSPVLWVAMAGLIYSTVLVPAIPALPDWTSIAGFVVSIFGIVNNPCNHDSF